ncbi:hypothetical protein ACWD0G_26425, partial [Streptomyces goshikiensis]
MFRLPRPPRSLAGQLFAMQVLVVAVVVAGCAVFAYATARGQAEDAARRQAGAVARSVADSPSVREAVREAAPGTAPAPALPAVPATGSPSGSATRAAATSAATSPAGSATSPAGSAVGSPTDSPAVPATGSATRAAAGAPAGSGGGSAVEAFARLSAVLQPYAERVRTDSGVDFVTIMAPDGRRWTHPDPRRIGERFIGNTAPALRGETFSETYTGTLGPSIRVVTPLNDNGRVIGMVSAGITVHDMTPSDTVDPGWHEDLRAAAPAAELHAVTGIRQPTLTTAEIT